MREIPLNTIEFIACPEMLRDQSRLSCWTIRCCCKSFGAWKSGRLTGASLTSAPAAGFAMISQWP